MTGPITKKSGGPRVKKLQRGIKKTLRGHGFDQWAKGVIVDGEPGQMTFKMARLAGSMQGLSEHQLETIRDGKITRHAELILTHEKPRSAEMKRRAKKRDARFDKIRWHLKHPPEPKDGIVTFDGKPCAGWIARELQKARDRGWGGVLVSGVRSPEHSEDLCFAMCGGPSCSGMCAGRSSNHCCPPSFKCKDPEGAADCSDYLTLARILREMGSKLHNALPRDLVHFSASGN